MFPEARQEKLLVKEVGDELVVYDHVRHSAHRLNPAATWIWRHCDGQTSPAKLASLLAREGTPPADEAVVLLGLRQLEKAHLLRAPMSRSTEQGTVSRRVVVRKLGLAGAMVPLLPLVSSIIAPTPAMAQYKGECEEDFFNTCARGCADAQQECIDSGLDPESCMRSGAACTERCCSAAGCKGTIC